MPKPVIVSATRTAIGTLGGAIAGVPATTLGAIAVREAIQITPDPPGYLYRNTDEIKGAFIRVPERDEIPLPVTLEERLVVEFYS